MKKVLLLLLFFITLFISSCGKSLFDSSMEKGKNYLQTGNYQEAAKQFDIAYIENPSDKDLALLTEKAQLGIYNIELKDELAKYQEENSSVYAQYAKIWLEMSLIDGVPSEEVIKEKLIAISDVYSKALDVGRNHSKYPEISTAHDDFVNALDALRSYYNEFIKLYSNSEKVSSLRTNAYMGMYKDYIKQYDDKIKVLREK